MRMESGLCLGLVWSTMWFLILPTASVAIFGVLLAFARQKDAAFEECRMSRLYDDIEMQEPLPTASPTEEDEEDQVVVTDVLGWLHDAADRILLTAGPEVRTVDAPAGTSTFLTFTARGKEFELWLGGPSYIGPFPRLKQVCDDGPGVEVERSPVCLEKTIVGFW